MIEFNCFCKHRFRLEDDQAGGSLQCPRCGKLVDVPSLDDLHKLNADGTYTIGALELVSEPDRLSRATRAFTRQRVDEDGQQIDLRLSLEDVLKVGADKVTLDIKDDAEARPKYDPITGELVRPIDIKTNPEAASIPMAKPAISYAALGLDRQVGAAQALIELFKPLNLIVMLVILLAHLFAQVVLAIVIAGIFFIAPVLLLVMVLIISHYGNVVDEIGPTGRDELPRPLREASWSDDIWNPFKYVFAALIICFFPLGWLLPNVPPPMTLLLGLPMFILGSFFFPAIVLTLSTSGTIENMRPDRVLRVIGACGISYLGAVLAWLVGISIYLFGIYAYNYTFFKMFFKSQKTSPFFQASVSLPILFVGIMAMHYFGWLVGLLYRKYHANFPWVMQRHVSKRKDTVSQLEARNRERAAAALNPQIAPPPQRNRGL